VSIVVYYEIVQIWKDEFLVWKPGDYGGIRYISVSPSSIWTPDVELYNRYMIYLDCFNHCKIWCFFTGTRICRGWCKHSQ